eukprot:6179813-Pleurochrysis_carterae.AAC.1
MSKPKASTERNEDIVTAEARSIQDQQSKQLQLQSASVQCKVLPCMRMRKFRGMLVACAQQDTRKRQADFLYRPGASRSCGHAMEPVGPKPGKQGFPCLPPTRTAATLVDRTAINAARLPRGLKRPSPAQPA